MLQELPLSVAYSTKEGFMNIYKIYNSYTVHCEVMCYMTQGILRYGKPKFLKIGEKPFCSRAGEKNMLNSTVKFVFRYRTTSIDIGYWYIGT